MRDPLNRDRVLRAAVALADGSGIDALSMRTLAQELHVVPMALYKLAAQAPGAAVVTDWRTAVRQRILSARRTLLRHPWAARVIESRTAPTPVVLDYVNSLIGLFRSGGFSADLTHHAMHALGSRMWGFTRDLFPIAPPPDRRARAAMLRELATRYPYLVEIATSGRHGGGPAVGAGGDDQFEFEFALDLLLDGFERLHRRGWTCTAGRRPGHR